MEIIKYPDGTNYAVASSFAPIVHRINTYEDLFNLHAIVDAHNRQFDFKPTITIPWLMAGQEDDEFKYNGAASSFGLSLILRQLIAMDANFKIYHPHNAQAVKIAFDVCGKKVEIIDNSKFINSVLNKLPYETQEGLENNLILMSADAGGFKPLMKLCDTLKWQGGTYSASKARTKDGMVQHIDVNNFHGKDILIIDDISVFGGTFKGLASMLRQRNVGKLYLAVSHMAVKYPHTALDVCASFDKVFTTNSKWDDYSTPQVEQPDNLNIIKLF